MRILKHHIPIAVASISGIILVLVYYSPHPLANATSSTLNKWVTICMAFALAIGLINLMYIHFLRIKNRRPGYGYSVFVYIGFGLMFSFGAYNHGYGPFVSMQKGGTVDWLYQNVQVPCITTMFSVLAFFIASAAYRAFRAKTAEATILLIAAVIVMLGAVPIGHLISGKLPAVAGWLLYNPNMAVKRAILIGVGLGIVATSLRVIFGIERSYLGGE